MKFAPIYTACVLLAATTTEASGSRHNAPAPPAIPRRAASVPAVKPPHKPSSKPALRRTRQQAPPRRLGENDMANAFSGPVGSLLNMPRELLGSLLLGQNPMTGAGYGGTQTVQQNVGDFVDRTRNVADSSFDTVEQLVSGFAQRGRNVLDRATARAADIVDHTVALGSNSIGAGFETARGMQNEAKRMAGQAAGVAQGAVKAGERAVAGAFDGFSTVVNRNMPMPGDSSSTPKLGSLLTNPLGSLVGLASSIA